MRIGRLRIAEALLLLGGIAAVVAGLATEPRMQKQSHWASENAEDAAHGALTPAGAMMAGPRSNPVARSESTGSDGSVDTAPPHPQTRRAATPTGGSLGINHERASEAGWERGSNEHAPAAANVDAMSVEDLIEALGRLEGEALEAAIGRLAAYGDAGFTLLVIELNRDGQTFGFRHKGVRVLEMMNTPQARMVLRAMALGEHTDANPNLERWAAQAYLAGAEDQREALELLESRASPVLNLALLRLRGVAVDASLMGRLGQLSNSPGRAVRISAALVLADDPTARVTSDGVKMIAGAAVVASSRDDANQNSGHGYYTSAEQEYSVYLNALSTIRVSGEFLRRQAPALKGFGRDLAYIALGRKGDETARPALVEILKHSNNGMIRAWAADALGVVGTRDDLEVLRGLRESDPDVRKTAGPAGPVTIRPVRAAATGAIAAIEKRAEEN